MQTLCAITQIQPSPFCMPLQATCTANFQISMCCRRKSAENCSVVVRIRFFLAVRRTLATTIAKFKTTLRAVLIAFRRARGSTASAATALACSTSSTSSLFFASFLLCSAVAFAFLALFCCLLQGSVSCTDFARIGVLFPLAVSAYVVFACFVVFAVFVVFIVALVALRTCSFRAQISLASFFVTTQAVSNFPCCIAYAC